MSTVTSFTSPAEMCTVHVLHGEGRNESKGAEGLLGEASVVSDGQRRRCWWQLKVSSPSLPLFFSLFFFFFFCSYFLSSSSGLLFFFLSFGLSNLPSSTLSLSSFSLLFSGLFFSCPLPLSLFFFLFFYSFVSFFFSFFSVLSSFLFCSRSPLSCVLFFYRPSVFIGKNRGGTWLGQPTIARGGMSPPFLQHVGGHGSAEQMGVLGRCLFELKGGRKVGENKGTKAPFPCFLHVQGKKKTYDVIQNNTVLGLFFLTVYEMAPFWAKCAVSSK